MRHVEWTSNPDPDAEYNSTLATCKGHQIEVFSNRTHDDWGYVVDDNESHTGYSSKEAAQKAALRDVDND